MQGYYYQQPPAEGATNPYSFSIQQQFSTTTSQYTDLQASGFPFSLGGNFGYQMPKENDQSGAKVSAKVEAPNIEL